MWDDFNVFIDFVYFVFLFVVFEWCIVSKVVMVMFIWVLFCDLIEINCWCLYYFQFVVGVLM